MATMANETEPHRLSEVLTGAMFDVLIAIGENYQKTGRRPRAEERRSQAFWFAADRMQRMAIQPLDLLPPVEVTFRDYALAVCRSQQLADPLDPEDYYGMLIKVFRKRGILSEDDEQELTRAALSQRAARPERAPQHRRHLAIARGGLSLPRRQPRGPADPRQPRLLRRRPLRRQEARPAEPAAAAPDRPRNTPGAKRSLLDGARFGQFAGRTTDDAVRRHARVQRRRQRAVVDDEARLAAVRRQARPRGGKTAEMWDDGGDRGHGPARRRCSTTSPRRSPPAASARSLGSREGLDRRRMVPPMIGGGRRRAGAVPAVAAPAPVRRRHELRTRRENGNGKSAADPRLQRRLRRLHLRPHSRSRRAASTS